VIESEGKGLVEVVSVEENGLGLSFELAGGDESLVESILLEETEESNKEDVALDLIPDLDDLLGENFKE
jgi:hypothetical protein